jgi:hypothetical protein
MSGEKLQTVDVMIHDGATKMSLILKRETKSAEPYVVLANLSAGNKQYSIFEPDQFEQFADAVYEIRTSLRRQENSEIRLRS